MKRRPIIAISPLYDAEKDRMGMLKQYTTAIESHGATALVISLTADSYALQQVAELCDGLLLTGGPDIDPLFYGEEPIPELGDVVRERDALESTVFAEFLQLDKPILGVCRGCQMITAAMGGTLWQDLPSQFPSDVSHRNEGYPTSAEKQHEVSIPESTPLHRLLGRGTLLTNSYHHQAAKALPGTLKAMATAEDGVIEAVYAPERRFVWGIQWHPELFALQEEESRGIFGAFVDACRESL